MGGLCIKHEGEDLLSKKELLQNAVGEGVKILDNTGEEDSVGILSHLYQHPG